MGDLMKHATRYGIAGVFNTLFGYGVIFGLMWLTVTPLVANVIGYVLALILVFVVNRQWVFEAKHGHVPRQAIRFVSAFAVCFIANYVVLTALITYSVNPYLAQILSGCCYTALMFPLSRYYVFRERGRKNGTGNAF